MGKVDVDNDESFFRHEYGHLVAMLIKKVGVQHLHHVEDAVQNSLLRAIETWNDKPPQNPRAWLYKVACNAFIDEMRKRKRQNTILEKEGLLLEVDESKIDLLEKDALLHMIFVCCDLELPKTSQLVLCLKVLCGFNAVEIAKRLFISEASVHKRYQRARDSFRAEPQKFNQHFTGLDLNAENRLDSVLSVLYVLFTEGYLSQSMDYSIRRDLCEQSERILELLLHLPLDKKPKIHALLALMSFNLARMNARLDAQGVLLLLEEQDRTLWNSEQINQGFGYLVQSAQGDQLSRYHLEAAVAAEHCRAQNFTTTDWRKICLYYEQLETLYESYFYRLNRAIAMAEWCGANEGLELLLEREPPAWMQQSYHWFAVTADLYARCGIYDKSNDYYTMALQYAPTKQLKDLIVRRSRQSKVSKP